MEWNQKVVRETLQPFVETARMVRVNSRKPYSPAGGRKRKGAYIDSYCAIKVPGLNATFNCFVEKQGDEPRFSPASGDYGRDVQHQIVCRVR